MHGDTNFKGYDSSDLSVQFLFCDTQHQYHGTTSNCYIASAETKRDWLIHGHVALDKCNVSLTATSEQ